VENTAIPRLVSWRLVEAIADTPVVVLNGARQVGKSTLVKSLAYPGTSDIVTLDDLATRSAAGFDPRAFVQRAVDTLVIDEAQLEPSLFRAIKAEVDRDRRPGKFLITGSSRLLSAPDMADSLVGRVEIVELWPFSQDELLEKRSEFIDAAFGTPSKLMQPGALSRRDLIERICAGGFPDAVGRSPRRRAAWFDGYVTTTIERVVRQVADIERAAEMPRLIRLCAARTAQELNVSNLADEFRVPVRTVSSYVAHLATAFLIQLVPAWSTNLSAKVIHRPKLVMLDSGLSAHLIGATPTTVDRSGGPFGQLLETFVISEIRKQLTWTEQRVSMYHFRDRNGVEVDVVLEHPDGRIVGIEVKATSTPRAEDFRGLRYLAQRLGDRFVRGILLSAAPEAIPFGERLVALPVDALWR
jgi:predicted AAA+ superfamily ATPase